MAIRTIRTDGDPVLRKISKPVKEITPKIVTLVDDMMDTMYEIPSDDTIEECVVTKAAVDGESEPLTIHDESLKKAK